MKDIHVHIFEGLSCRNMFFLTVLCHILPVNFFKRKIPINQTLQLAPPVS